MHAGTITSFDRLLPDAGPVAPNPSEHPLARRMVEDLAGFMPLPWSRRADRWSSADEWFPIGGAAGTTTDRRGGRDLPTFWNELDLRGFRVLARHLAASNAFAIGFLGRLTDYHVRKGFSWQACLKGAKKTPYAAPGSDPLVQKAQGLLDSWRDANKWPLRSREAFRRWRRDGEVFGRFFAGGWDRLPAFRFVEPEQVGDPDGSTDGPRSFGIETDPDDVETRWAYHVWELQNPTPVGEWIDADRVVHLRANVDSTVKRGVTDFLPLAEQLDDVRQLLRTLLKTSIRQAAVAWRERFPTATLEQVRSMVPLNPAGTPAMPETAWWASYDYRTPRGSNGFTPAAVLRTEGNREFDDGPTAGGVGNFLQAEQAALRGCCVRWGLPEYAGSADASNNNFASSLVAGSPFAVAVEGAQAEFGTEWERPIALKVLDLAAEAGLLTREERSRLDVEVTEPAVVSPKPQEETSRRQILHQSGVLSATTWQLQEQLDPQHEQANFEAEKQRGMVPGDEPPPDDGGFGADDPPGDDGGGDPFAGLLGEAVVTESAYSLLSESDPPPGKVWKTITVNRGGKQYSYKRLVNAPKATPAKKPAAKAEPVAKGKPAAKAGAKKEPAEEPKGKAVAPKPTPAAPHAQARAALDTYGIPHAHLTDDEIAAKLRAAFGGAEPEKPAAKPAATPEPAATPAPKPKAAKKAEPAPAPKPAAKARIPTGHEVAHDHGGGVVTSRDPRTGDYATHFPTGAEAAAGEKLHAAVADAAQLLAVTGDGYAPVSHLVAEVQRNTGATRGEVLAAVSAMRKARAITTTGMVEGGDLQKIAAGERHTLPLAGSKGLHDAFIYDEKGRPMANFVLPRAGMSVADVVAEYQKNKADVK